MTYHAREYATHDDACAAAECLESFGLKPSVIGPVRVSMLHGGREIEHWEVSCVVPPQQPDAPGALPADPYEPDEHDRGRSTLWDDTYENRIARGD